MGKKALVLGPVGLRCIKILQTHAEAQKITNAWIAEQVELSESTISRVFNGMRALTVDELDAVADAVGLIGWEVLREAEEPATNVVAFPRPVPTLSEDDLRDAAAKHSGRGPEAEQGVEFP